MWGAMLEAYCKLKTEPNTIMELEEALELVLLLEHFNTEKLVGCHVKKSITLSLSVLSL